MSLINFVLSFAFLFVIYIGTKLFGGEDNTYVNVTGTMAFVAQVVNTMPAFGALGHSNSINETFLTVNQVVDATSAATSAWGVFIGIFGISILRSSNSNLIPSYAVYAGWGGAVLVMVSTLGFDYGVLPEIAGFITLVLGGLVLYPLFIFGLGKAMKQPQQNRGSDTQGRSYMFVRLTLADVKEGEMNNALDYVKNTVMPSYDGISGLLGIAACATNDGRFMAWSTWANEEAKNASIDKFNQALAGAAEMLDGQPK